MRKTLNPKTSLQVVILLVCNTSAAMMLEGIKVFLFTTKRTKDTKNG